MSQDFNYYESSATNSQRLEEALERLSHEMYHASSMEKMSFALDVFEGVKSLMLGRLHRALQSGDTGREIQLVQEILTHGELALNLPDRPSLPKTAELIRRFINSARETREET